MIRKYQVIVLFNNNNDSVITTKTNNNNNNNKHNNSIDSNSDKNNNCNAKKCSQWLHDQIEKEMAKAAPGPRPHPNGQIEEADVAVLVDGLEVERRRGREGARRGVDAEVAFRVAAQDAVAHLVVHRAWRGSAALV